MNKSKMAPERGGWDHSHTNGGARLPDLPKEEIHGLGMYREEIITISNKTPNRKLD